MANEPMSTINAFVRIESSISQPRSRVSDYALPPFGDEWALLPPEASLRAELCALLRTFCLHDETIWSMCHWASAWPGRTSTPLVEPALSIVTAAGARGRAGASMRTAPDAPALSGSFGHRGGGRIAGACAISAAAILAWVAITHLSQPHTPPHAASAQQPDEQPDVATNRAAAAPQRDAGHPSSAQQPLATAASQPHWLEAGHARHGSRHASSVTRLKAHHPGAQSANRGRQAGTTGASIASRHLSPAAATHRLSARSSAAGGYSPFAPAKLAIDEYASVTMTTNARLRDAAPAQTMARHGNLGDTEWMSHMSQRRVTEVPDAFSK
jgi:hypothetical protein